jgi:hypothetical protein
MENTKKWIGCFRVSTGRQAASGLGLEAQRAAAVRQIGAGELAAEYIEVESGKKHYTYAVPCAIREQLVRVYIDFTLLNIEAGNAIVDKKSDEWRTATEKTRNKCTEALEALNVHRLESLARTRTHHPARLWPRRRPGVDHCGVPGVSGELRCLRQSGASIRSPETSRRRIKMGYLPRYRIGRQVHRNLHRQFVGRTSAATRTVGSG